VVAVLLESGLLPLGLKSIASFHGIENQYHILSIVRQQPDFVKQGSGIFRFFLQLFGVTSAAK
jgi:hypothetical protein